MNQGDPKLLLADGETYLTTVEEIRVLAYDLQYNCTCLDACLEAFFEHKLFKGCYNILNYSDYKFFKSLFLQKVKQEQDYEGTITDFYYSAANRINEVLNSEFKTCYAEYIKIINSWGWFSGEESFVVVVPWEDPPVLYFDRYTLCEGFIILHRSSFPNETKILTPFSGSTLNIRRMDGEKNKPVMIGGFDEGTEANKILQTMFNKVGITDIEIIYRT